MSAYTRRTVNWLLRELGVPTRPQGRPPKLTAQGERDLLIALSRGETWRAVGARLGISGNTILRIQRKHRSNSVPRGTRNLTLTLKYRGQHNDSNQHDFGSRQILQRQGHEG